MTNFVLKLYRFEELQQTLNFSAKIHPLHVSTNFNFLVSLELHLILIQVGMIKFSKPSLIFSNTVSRTNLYFYIYFFIYINITKSWLNKGARRKECHHIVMVSFKIWSLWVIPTGIMRHMAMVITEHKKSRANLKISTVQRFSSSLVHRMPLHNTIQFILFY